MPEGAKFCTGCGAKLLPPQPAPRPAAPEPAAQQPKPQRPTKRRKKSAAPVIVAVVLALLAVAAAVAGVVIFRNSQKATLQERVVKDIPDYCADAVEEVYGESLSDGYKVKADKRSFRMMQTMDGDYRVDGTVDVEGKNGESYEVKVKTKVRPNFLYTSYEFVDEPDLDCEVPAPMPSAPADHTMESAAPAPTEAPAESAWPEGTPDPSAYLPSGSFSDYYLLPTDTQYISESDLYRFTKDEMNLVHNEIFARHGYTFKDETIRSYFLLQSWYVPDPDVNAETFDKSMLSECEQANLETIIQYEKDMGWRN